MIGPSNNTAAGPGGMIGNNALWNPTEHLVKYARLPTRKGIRTLHARLFLPPTASLPHPLLIWLHAGGFRRGKISHPAHSTIARHFSRHGVATAFIEYRLRTQIQNLSQQSQSLVPDLLADVEQFDFAIQPFFTGPAAISAVEDCIVFFQWLDQKRDIFGLGRQVMLGGSSSGAITVLNTLFLAPHLGIGLPQVTAAFVLSGAFAYPSFYSPNITRILAQHRPTDHKVPIASIRHFAKIAKRQCTLLEDQNHAHGGYRLNRGETDLQAIDRLMQFARQPAL